MAKAALRVHVGLYNNETAELCHWHVPGTHYLESWSDTRAYDGTIGIVQPLILPLYDGHSAHEILALFSGDAGKSGHDIVRDYWQSQRAEKGQAFEALWERSLHDGIIARTALPPVSVSVHSDFGNAMSSPAAEGSLEIAFYPDPAVGDGRYANNAWLQELPKPITRTTWDNAALISSATAQKIGVNQNDYVTLEVGGRKVDAGIFIVPGHPADAVTLHLGGGRTRAGNVGDGCGFNANLVRTSTALWIAGGVRSHEDGQEVLLCLRAAPVLDRFRGASGGRRIRQRRAARSGAGGHARGLQEGPGLRASRRRREPGSRTNYLSGLQIRMDTPGAWRST